MEQQFTPEQIDYMNKALPVYIKELTEQVINLIENTERKANDDFAKNGITFTGSSAANADYLMAALHEALFERLHQGDPKLASRILTMAAKRLGISLHVD